MSAFLLFGAFYLVYRTARSNKPFLYAALTGLMLGAALMTEYPTALIVAGIGLYAIYKWRRLALVVDGVPDASPAVSEERKGPRVGSPEAAVQGFLKSAGLASIEQASIVSDPKKGEFYVARIEKPAQTKS